MAEIFYTFLLAMTPIGELRLAIPMGLLVYNLNDFLVYIISFLGNSVPVVFLLLFFEPISKFLSEKSRVCQRILLWVFEKTRQKHTKKIEKYGLWALAIFTAIPLPLTGGWTASLIAFLFDIPFKKALIAISAGVAAAGLIVLLALKTGVAIEKYFGSQILIGALLTIAFCGIMIKIMKEKNNKYK